MDLFDVISNDIKEAMKAKTLLLFTPDKAVPIWQKPNWPR